jgi:hypothetical protein
LELGSLHAGEEAEGGIGAKLERLDVRLARVEGAMLALQDRLLPDATARPRVAEETNRLKQMIQCLISMDGTKFPRLKDGTIDAYAIVRAGVVENHTFAELTQNRHGLTQAPIADIGKGNYRNFPYERGGRWAIKSSTRASPVLWEKTADRNGMVVVAFSNGAVKYIKQSDLKRMIAVLQKK